MYEYYWIELLLGVIFTAYVAYKYLTKKEE